MTPGRALCCAFAFAVAGLMTSPTRTLAAWPHDPYSNVMVYGANNYRNTPRACSDGAGGIFACWEDYEGAGGCQCGPSPDVVLRQVSRDGLPLGVGLTLSSGGNAGSHTIAPDGQGGALVAWRQQGVLVQRVDASGAILWAEGGVGVASDTADISAGPVLASDGQGGALVAWVERRDESGFTTYPRVYVQRVSANGSLLWGVGRHAAETEWEMRNPSLASSGDGGAIVAWEDLRGSDPDIYAQKLDPSGQLAWPGGPDEDVSFDGVPVATASGAQTKPRVVSDGAGGGSIVWEDERNGNLDLYAQRMTNNGYPSWATGGRPVTTAAGAQQDFAIDSDGGGGVVVAWRDDRNAADPDVYAQRLDAAGQSLWTPNGVALCEAAGEPTGLQAVTDGSGGIIASWTDSRLGAGFDVWAQRVSADGTVRWAGDGAAVSLVAEDQLHATLAADGRGGAIVAWDDARSEYSREIFGQRIDRSGDLGDPAPTIASVLDVPLDQGGKVKLSWYASYLDADPFYPVASYWVWRSVPESAALAALRDGARMLGGDTDLRASATDPSAMILTTMESVGTVFWEFVGAQAATADSGYSMVVATTSDSMPEGNPPTLLRVQARHRDGITFWNSTTASGYSKDNLPPPSPAGFVVTGTGGVLRLHWNPSPAPDFLTFRLYKGASADFVPGPENLVAVQSDTGYTAPTDYSIYKLAAMDTHGNASPYSALSTGTIVAVSDVPVVTLGLDAAPNPARDRLSLRFGLPRSADVRITMFDVAGRAVRELARGPYPAGSHVLECSREALGGVASGLYYLRLETGASRLVRRVVVSR